MREIKQVDLSNYFLTPFGYIPKDLVREVMQVGGLIWDKKYKTFNIKSYNTEHWKINAANNKLSNEKKWYKGFGYLPLAFNNFEVALLAHDGNIKKAIKMCKTFYFRNGKPIYLPDYLCEINHLDKNVRHFTYGRIFREWETLKLTI